MTTSGESTSALLAARRSAAPARRACRSATASDLRAASPTSLAPIARVRDSKTRHAPSNLVSHRLQNASPAARRQELRRRGPEPRRARRGAARSLGAPTNDSLHRHVAPNEPLQGHGAAQSAWCCSLSHCGPRSAHAGESAGTRARVRERAPVCRGEDEDACGARRNCTGLLFAARADELRIARCPVRCLNSGGPVLLRFVPPKSAFCHPPQPPNLPSTSVRSFGVFVASFRWRLRSGDSGRVGCRWHTRRSIARAEAGAAEEGRAGGVGAEFTKG